MFYLTEQPPEPVGYVEKSYAAQWVPWLASTLPAGLDAKVRLRLISNLKHILVGLEMKVALLLPHHLKLHGRPVLLESHAQLLNFEFAGGVYSVCEGFGAAWLHTDEGRDGTDRRRIYISDWRPAFVRHVAPDDPALDEHVRAVKDVRDRLHQDQLAARADIDWHTFDREKSFEPALAALQALLRLNADKLPPVTNLLPNSEEPSTDGAPTAAG